MICVHAIRQTQLEISFIIDPISGRCEKILLYRVYKTHVWIGGAVWRQTHITKSDF